LWIGEYLSGKIFSFDIWSVEFINLLFFWFLNFMNVFVSNLSKSKKVYIWIYKCCINESINQNDDKSSHLTKNFMTIIIEFFFYKTTKNISISVKAKWERKVIIGWEFKFTKWVHKTLEIYLFSTHTRLS
jgi:hypothetical protein